jgi:hypothetical protein
MPEQPQWSERTLDMPPQDPWAEPPTAQVPPPNPFSTGRAAVNPHPHPRARQFAAEHEPTGTGWPGGELPQPRRTARDLRRGGEWTTAALLFAFVCWGIWAISSNGNLTTSVIVFVLSLIVAAGLFTLSRLVGRIVLEKQFHRIRRSARGSHLVASIFLVGVGVAHLQQTEWVMTANHWVLSLFG